MSIVLWANVLIEGAVKSDETDYIALYKHSNKLNRLTKSLGLIAFSSICDTTDSRFNLNATAKLPDGMQSTNELMAKEGVWMPTQEAIVMLEALRQHITSKNIRFGLISNQQQVVLAELDKVLHFVKNEVEKSKKFNFAVVM